MPSISDFIANIRGDIANRRRVGSAGSSPTQLYQQAGVTAPGANAAFRDLVARNRANRVSAGSTQGYQPSNTGGGGGGGGAPVSTLASLPQTPELLALIKSGMIREGMPPEQALAILATSGLSAGVGVDVKALMDMIKAEYARTTGDITTAQTDWLQEILGANAPAGTEMDALYAQDPMWANSASVLGELEETSDLNEATDLAWFAKMQEAQQEYYNGLMASISTGGLPAAGGSGGGGGGGGGYGGGGGGGGSGGDSFTDPRTRLTEGETYKETSTDNLSSNYPGFGNALLGMTDDPTLQAYIRNIWSEGGGTPMGVQEALLDAIDANVSQQEAAALAQTQSDAFNAAAPGELQNALDRYSQLTGMTIGDNPETQEIEWEYLPEGTVAPPQSPVQQAELEEIMPLVQQAINPVSMPALQQLKWTQRQNWVAPEWATEDLINQDEEFFNNLAQVQEEEPEEEETPNTSNIATGGMPSSVWGNSPISSQIANAAGAAGSGIANAAGGLGGFLGNAASNIWQGITGQPSRDDQTIYPGFGAPVNGIEAPPVDWVPNASNAQPNPDWWFMQGNQPGDIDNRTPMQRFMETFQNMNGIESPGETTLNGVPGPGNMQSTTVPPWMMGSYGDEHREPAPQFPPPAENLTYHPDPNYQPPPGGYPTLEDAAMAGSPAAIQYLMENGPTEPVPPPEGKYNLDTQTSMRPGVYTGGYVPPDYITTNRTTPGPAPYEPPAGGYSSLEEAAANGSIAAQEYLREHPSTNVQMGFGPEALARMTQQMQEEEPEPEPVEPWSPISDNLSPLAAEGSFGNIFMPRGGQVNNLMRNIRAENIRRLYNNPEAMAEYTGRADWGLDPMGRVSMEENDAGDWNPQDLLAAMQGASDTARREALAAWTGGPTGNSPESFDPTGYWTPPTPEEDVLMWQMQQALHPYIQQEIDKANTYLGLAPYRQTDVAQGVESEGMNVQATSYDPEVAMELSTLGDPDVTGAGDVFEEPTYDEMSGPGESARFRIPQINQKPVNDKYSTEALIDQALSKAAAQNQVKQAAARRIPSRGPSGPKMTAGPKVLGKASQEMRRPRRR